MPHISLTPPDRQDKFKRLYAAANADVYCFQEEWDEGKFNEGVAKVLPERFNTHWASGCAIASKYKLTPLPMTLDRAAAALITTDAAENVVVISAHFKCCGYAGSSEDNLRVQQAEQIVGEIKRMRENAFGPEATDAPVILIGDYNLVGSRKPLDVINKAGLKDVLCRANTGPAYTWRGLKPDEVYWPGRLDLVSVNGVKNAKGYVLDSGRMSDDQRKKLGLEAEDSQASDHLVLVVDVKLDDK